MADRTVSVDFVTRYVATGVTAMRRDVKEIRGEVAKTMRDNRAEMEQVGRAAGAMGVAIAGGLAAATRQFMGFEREMNRVGAISGATGQQFDQLGDLAKELGRTTVYTAGQAADAMGFLAMAGFEANTIMEALPNTLTLAASAGMDLARAADITSNILTGYAMSTDELAHANDVLVATFTSSNTSLEQLGEAMKYAAPVAAAAGVEFEEAAAAIGLMGNAGIQGSMAGTSLRGAISRLLNPTAQVSSLLAELGVQVTDSSGNLLTLTEIVGNLQTAAVSTGDMMAIFGQRAGPAMAALVSQGSTELRQFTEDLRESGGTAQHVADRQLQGLSGSWVRMTSAVEGAAISLGEKLAPAAKLGVDGVTALASGFAALPGPAQTAVAAGGGVAGMALAAAGGFALLGPRILATKDALTTLAAQAPRTAAAVRAVGSILTGPVGWAIGAGIAALTLYGTAQANTRRKVQELTATLDEQTGALTENSRGWLTNALAESGAFKHAETLGLAKGDLIRYLEGEADALEVVNGAINRYLGGVGPQADAAFRLTGILRDQSHVVRASQETWREEAEATAEAAGRYFDMQHALSRGVSAFEVYRRGLIDNTSAAADLAQSVHAGKLTMDEAQEAALAAGIGLDELAGSFEEVESAAEAAAKKLEERQDAWYGVADQFLGLSGAMQRAQDEVRTAAEEAADKHNAAIDDQIRALKRGSTEQREALQDRKKTWEDFADEVTLEQVTRHLEDLNGEFRDWSSDIETITARAGTGVAERLAMMGPEWAPIVAQAVDATAGELARLDQAMADNIELQHAAAKMAVQMEILEEIVRQGSNATVDSVAEAIGVVPDVVAEVFRAMGTPEVTVEADVDQALREMAEAAGFAEEFDRMVAIATYDIENDDAVRRQLESMGLAHEWDSTTAQAHFDAENEKALAAFFEAKGMGDEWDAYVAAAKIDADISAAAAAIDTLISRLRNAGFTQGQAAWSARLTAQGAAAISARTNHSGGMAGTGPITSGPLKPDEVLAKLQRGEFVVNRDSTSRWRPLLEGINSFHDGGFVGAPFNASTIGSIVSGAMGRSGSGYQAAIREARALIEAWERAVEVERQADRRRGLVDDVRDAQREVNAAKKTDERRRANERLAEARKRVAEHDRDAARAAEQSAIANEMARLEERARRAENRDSYRFERMTAAEQVRWLDERIAAERQFTDEWMRLTGQRASILADEARAAREMVEASLAVLNRMADGHQRHLDAVAAAEQRHAQQVVDARRRATQAINDLVAARRAELEDQLRADLQGGDAWAWSASSIAAQHDRNIANNQAYRTALEQLRAAGLSEQALSFLGLDAGAHMLQQVKVLLRDSADDIARLNDSVSRAQREAERTVAAERVDDRTRLAREITSIEADLHAELAVMQAEHIVAMAELNAQWEAEQRRLAAEMAAIGAETGAGWIEEMNAHIAAGIPELESHVARVRQLMSEALAAQSAAGVSPLAAQVAAYRASVGAAPDSASDDIWARRIAAGTHSMDEAMRRIATERGVRVFDAGLAAGPWRSGQLGINLSGRDEWVATTGQMEALTAQGGRPQHLMVSLAGAHVTLRVGEREFDAYVEQTADGRIIAHDQQAERDLAHIAGAG